MSFKLKSGKPVVVNKWDGVAVRYALDDAIKELLMKRGSFVESHRVFDIRLALTTIAVAVAGFALVWDWKYPFPVSKPVLATCAITYFIFSTIVTGYMMFYEAGWFFSGLQRDSTLQLPDNKVAASSAMNKYEHLYTLVMEFTDGESKESKQETEVVSVTEFIDVDDHIVEAKLAKFVDKVYNRLMARFEKKKM